MSSHGQSAWNVETSPPAQKTNARRARFEAARATFQQSARVIKSLSGSGADGSLEQRRAGAAHAEGDRFAEDPNVEPEVREVVEELVQALEHVAEEERQSSWASTSPPVLQTPKSLGAHWILAEACLLEMQEIKARFEAEKAHAHALRHDLAVQKQHTKLALDKASALEQEREEEAQAARREAQTVQRDLSDRTTELRDLRKKLAKAEQEVSGERLKAQQEIKAIREQLRAREEIMPVRENQPKEEQAAKSAREKCVVCQDLDQKVSMAVCNKGHAVCKTCFERYADAEMSNGQRQIRCPLWPAHLARCTGRFSEQNVAQILSAQLHERYMRGMREQPGRCVLRSTKNRIRIQYCSSAPHKTFGHGSASDTSDTSDTSDSDTSDTSAGVKVNKLFLC